MRSNVAANLRGRSEAGIETQSVGHRLLARWQSHNSLLCVGLDPVADRLPSQFRNKPKAFRDFCCAIADATAAEVCAFKPQAAHFAAEGAEDQLAETIAYIRTRYPDIPVILDAKRGDIGATAVLYAREAFERYNADIVTVNPYLGLESLQPYLAYAGRGVAILCRTSNPSADWLQCHPQDEPIYLRVARSVAQWNERGNLLLVGGATYPQDLARIRAVAESVPLLVPGIGAQGGDLRTVLRAGLDALGRGLVVNASRSILYADSTDFMEGARRAAQHLRTRIAAIAGELMRTSQRSRAD